MSRWDMYDELINGIPGGIEVKDVVVGLHWTSLLAEEPGNGSGGIIYAGMAGTVKGGDATGIEDGLFTGRELREVAEKARSWNTLEASVGMAAVNAWYNTSEKMKELGIADKNGELPAGSGRSVFSVPEERMKGKKVTVIGHFPKVSEQIGDICSLTILERSPRSGDVIDSACEYILPEQDYVFITGMTFANKTLPRLLELSEKAYVTMVGPSVPVTPVLFKYGVDQISGFYITRPEENRNIIAQSGKFQSFRTGVRVEYRKNG